MKYLMEAIITILLLTSLATAATNAMSATNVAVVIGCDNYVDQKNLQYAKLSGYGVVNQDALNHAIAIGCCGNVITQTNLQKAYLSGPGAITQDATNFAIAICYECVEEDIDKHDAAHRRLGDLVSADTKIGTIKVTKRTYPEGDTTPFDFTGDLGNFTLHGDGDWETFIAEPGVYKIIEIVPDGWELTKVVCSGATYSCCTEIPGGIKVDLAAGESVNVTFNDALKA